MDKKELLYWNQSIHDNVLETLMLVMAVVFLCYVIKLAFFDHAPMTQDKHDKESES